MKLRGKTKYHSYYQNGKSEGEKATVHVVLTSKHICLVGFREITLNQTTLEC